MKWTRASERLPVNHNWLKEIATRNKNGSIVGMRFDSDRNSFISYDHLGQEFVELTTDIIEWLDESDESPESSVWPGMTEARQIMKDSMPRKEQLGYEFGFFKAFNWLQSRTAVKAEDSLPQIADNLGQPDIDWNNDHEFRKSNQQSQPTVGEYYAKDQMLVAFAMGYERKSKELDWSYFKSTAGGVKEEVKICKGCGVDWNISKKCWCLIPTFDQPFPSNPSIKQPTEDQILQGLQDFAHAENKRGRVPRISLNDFTAGINFHINWLLSIQPDK